MNLLLTTLLDQILVPIIIVAFFIVIYLAYSLRNRKYIMKAQQVIESLKPGMKLKTYSGIYGTVVSLYYINDVKVALIETGDGEHKSYFTIDASAIFDVEKDENIQSSETSIPAVEPVKKEKKTEEKSEIKKAEKKVDAKDKKTSKVAKKSKTK